MDHNLSSFFVVSNSFFILLYSFSKFSVCLAVWVISQQVLIDETNLISVAAPYESIVNQELKPFAIISFLFIFFFKESKLFKLEVCSCLCLENNSLQASLIAPIYSFPMSAISLIIEIAKVKAKLLLLFPLLFRSLLIWIEPYQISFSHFQVIFRISLLI